MVPGAAAQISQHKKLEKQGFILGPETTFLETPQIEMSHYRDATFGLRWVTPLGSPLATDLSFCESAAVAA